MIIEVIRPLPRMIMKRMLLPLPKIRTERLMRVKTNNQLLALLPSYHSLSGIVLVDSGETSF